MNQPCKDVAEFLQTSAIAVGTIGADLWYNEEPSAPDACVTIIDSTGRDPINLTGDTYERPNIFVRVRGKKGGQAAAYAKAKAVQVAMGLIQNETIGGTRYIGAWSIGSINALGKDNNDRPVFSLNFRIDRTPAP